MEYNIGGLGITKHVDTNQETTKSTLWNPVDIGNKKVSHNYLKETLWNSVEPCGHGGDGGGERALLDQTCGTLWKHVDANEGGGGEIGWVTRKDWDGREKPIACRYKLESRKIHPAVCEWHREEEDGECLRLKCPRRKLGWGRKAETSSLGRSLG